MSGDSGISTILMPEKRNFILIGVWPPLLFRTALILHIFDYSSIQNTIHVNEDSVSGAD